MVPPLRRGDGAAGAGRCLDGGGGTVASLPWSLLRVYTGEGEGGGYGAP